MGTLCREVILVIQTNWITMRLWVLLRTELAIAVLFNMLYVLWTRLFVMLQKYAWTGHNNFFIKGNIDSLSIGAGE